MTAHHRPLRGHDFDAQIVELELVVTVGHHASLRNTTPRTIASRRDPRRDAARRAGRQQPAADRPLGSAPPARRRRADGGAPTPLQLAIGFVTNFFDTLGIGSFATTTAVFRLLRIVPDELIPGTLLVGHALPVVTQALFFVSAVDVDPTQMTLLIAVCVAGGWLGAGVVAPLSRRAVQLGMGCALLSAATFMLLGMFGLFPAGGTALAFAPRAFAIALAINFVLGCAGDARHRQLRAEPDRLQPARAWIRAPRSRS